MSLFPKSMYVIWVAVDAYACFYTINPITDSVPRAVAVEEQAPPRVPLPYNPCLNTGIS